MKILDALSNRERAYLLRSGKREAFPPGSVICREGERDESLFFLLSGEAFATRSVSRRELIVAVIKEGECFGELSLILKVPRTTWVKARSRCDVLRLSSRSFKSHTRRFRGLERAMLRLLAQRLVATTAKASNIALQDVTTRLLASIRTYAEQCGESGTLSLRVEIPSQRLLAELAGTSREMVNRALKLLEQSGEIYRDGKLIILKK